MKNKVFKWLLSAAAAVIFLSVVVYFISAGFGDESIPQPCDKDTEDIKVAAVGDSTTYGLMVNNRSENAYPQQLEKSLGEEYCVENYGANNYAAMKSADYPYTGTQEYQDSLDFNPDIAVIMLGTNDSKNINWQNRKQFKEEYSELVDAYTHNNPDTEIYLATPPKAFNDADRPGDINNGNIDKIAEVVKEVSVDKDTGLIDINRLTRDKRQWFQPDGIHHNQDGAEGIAEEVYRNITE